MGNQCNGRTVVADETFVVEEAGFSIPVRTVKKMGWKRDLPDFRDRVLALPQGKKENLPPKVDLRPEEHFHIYDQGTLGSCTANAIGAAFHFDQIRQGVKDFTPSRLFIYYNERAMEGSIDKDAGAYIRDGIKSVHKIGACNEKLWPYDEAKFTDKPSKSCYEAAEASKAKEYARVPQKLEDMKAVLNEGLPFVFGFTVLSSFQTTEVAETGKMKMPGPYDFVMGGHAVQACGYDDKEEVIIVRNSWGEGWGDNGYFYMPYAYITNPGLAEDMWVIRFVSEEELPTKRAFA
jgi:C1A family cysteine protease